MDEEENKEFIQANQVQNIPTFILYKTQLFEIVLLEEHLIV